MPRATKIVCVEFDWSSGEADERLAGVLDVARTLPWRLTCGSPDLKPDAVIRDSRSRGRPSTLPAVLIGRYEKGDIRADDAAIARMAAEHFLDRGFRKFARPADLHAAVEFDETIVAAGHGPPLTYTDVSDAADLPSGIAVYAGRLILAHLATNACRRAGRRIPDDVAILGTGYKRLYCELSDPPLSTIDEGERNIGRRAAMRLDRILRGRPVPDLELVAPLGVVLRASTDTLAIADADVAAAVRFIREHAAGPLRVGDIVRAVDLDRRTLERRFQKSLGRPPAEVLRRHRVEMAAVLLRSTTLSMSAIATASGYRLPQHLAAAFRQLRGQTPSEYRASMDGPNFD